LIDSKIFQKDMDEDTFWVNKAYSQDNINETDMTTIIKKGGFEPPFEILKPLFIEESDLV
jgi:hypothetical protein